MQNTWRFSPLQGGLAFLPATVLIALFTPLTGLIAQWAGLRLYVLLVPALLAIGLSYLYIVVTLTPQSTYVGGLLPTFLVRGLAIPVVSSCTTLAVMSAVSTKQSGLASGTLGMARNIGTAFGVAVLSQVYLFYTNTTLPSSLVTSRAAADQFVVSGEGASRLIIEAVILQGFKLTALTCLVLCGSAAVLAFFIRTQMGKKGINTPFGSSAMHTNQYASDPPALQDVFFRIGGAEAGSATNSLVVNSANVILDDIWAWRADHGTGS